MVDSEIDQQIGNMKVNNLAALLKIRQQHLRYNIYVFSLKLINHWYKDHWEISQSKYHMKCQWLMKDEKVIIEFVFVSNIFVDYKSSDSPTCLNVIL